MPGPAEWRAQQAASLELERAVKTGAEPEPDRVPPFLGTILRRSREERGWTQAELAGRVFASVASIRRVEHSIAAPRAAADAAVALRAAVLLDVDPIQLTFRHNLGWEYGEQFEQLRALNPGWAALVERLNEVKERRADWWEADQR